ncbi:MAG TPA: Dyp-type peroxidase, partial [Galbitalea sp.]|nr:Dyp-type peroxidase [Galbitalea sp.]
NTFAPLASVPLLDWDVCFYVAATYEARVNGFLAALEKTRPTVQEIQMFRGYQREDGTEPFGYADGLRNIRTEERTERVFIHRDDRDIDEPEWADGGSYMAFLRIVQHPDQFAALANDEARDAVIGRKQDGTRLDLADQKVSPKEEPSNPPPSLPSGAHVGKVGPRGSHDDNQIFRRGLPFLETTDEGELRVGLNFCSFQATLEQFDVVFNDWAMTAGFPPGENAAGAVDQLLDPTRGLATIEHVGFFFVPPYAEDGLAAAILADPPDHRPAKTGRLIVHKRVLDPNDSSKRFERQGFRFQVVDAQGNVLPNSEFETNSGGVGLCPAELTVGDSYTLQEIGTPPVENVALLSVPFTVDGPVVQLSVVNTVPSGTPYGGAA